MPKGISQAKVLSDIAWTLPGDIRGLWTFASGECFHFLPPLLRVHGYCPGKLDVYTANHKASSNPPTIA